MAVSFIVKKSILTFSLSPRLVIEVATRVGHIRPVRLFPVANCDRLYDPMDCSPAGSSVHGILQARRLQWVAMPSSRASSRPRDRTRVSRIGRGMLSMNHLGSCHARLTWSEMRSLRAPSGMLGISLPWIMSSSSFVSPANDVSDKACMLLNLEKKKKKIEMESHF